MSRVKMPVFNKVFKASAGLVKETYSTDLKQILERLGNLHGVALLAVEDGSKDGLFKMSFVVSTAKAVEALQFIFTRWMTSYMGDYAETNAIPASRIYHLSKLTLEKVISPFDEEGIETLWVWTISTDASANLKQLPWRLSALRSSTSYLEAK